MGREDVGGIHPLPELGSWASGQVPARVFAYLTEVLLFPVLNHYAYFQSSIFISHPTTISLVVSPNIIEGCLFCLLPNSSYTRPLKYRPIASGSRSDSIRQPYNLEHFRKGFSAGTGDLKLIMLHLLCWRRCLAVAGSLYGFGFNSGLNGSRYFLQRA